jgi:hypothetical protein
VSASVQGSETPAPIWRVLKRQADDHVRLDTKPEKSDRERASRIRCPLCDWRPAASSRWTCSAEGTPEPPFNACGTVWNTFDTRGKCPGCSHQWIWTTCLHCHVPSRHVEWYQEG